MFPSPSVVTTSLLGAVKMLGSAVATDDELPEPLRIFRAAPSGMLSRFLFGCCVFEKSIVPFPPGYHRPLVPFHQLASSVVDTLVLTFDRFAAGISSALPSGGVQISCS